MCGWEGSVFKFGCFMNLALFCRIIFISITILTGALSWSTEKLQTIQVSGSFSVKAGIFRIAERYSTSLWDAGHTLCGRMKGVVTIWITFIQVSCRTHEVGIYQTLSGKHQNHDKMHINSHQLSRVFKVFFFLWKSL